MTVLVTGGFGFIGSHLVEHLLAQGETVHVVDNLSTSPLPLRDLLAAFNPEHLSRLTFSTIDFNQWTPDDKTPISAIYHLASPVGPAGILKYSGAITGQVVIDAYHAAMIADKHQVPLLFVSTSETYGGGVDGLCAEWMPRIIQAETTVRLEYATAKLAAETALINLTPIKSLRLAIIRPFNVAGPRQSGAGGFVLPRFVEQALRNEALTIFGDGRQRRTLTHVADIVEGMVLALKQITDMPAGSHTVYNLGHPENKLTILDLAGVVIEEARSQSTVTHVDGRSIYGPSYAESSDKFPDATKAMKELGWSPRHDVASIVRDTIAYIRKRGAFDA